MKPTPTKVREWIAQIKSDSGEAYTQELCELAASWGAEQAQQAPVEEPALPEPVVAREEYAVGTGEFYTAAQMHDHFHAGVRAGMVQSQDAKRLDWLNQTLFMSKWNGVIDSGSKVTWSIAPDYRHTTLKMAGNTLREAIDAAMQGGQQ